MISTTDDADRALKARLRSIWALGDYPAVAATVIPHLGAELVRACRVSPGQRVLDVAAGAGNAAIPAALAGATVTASDLTPELLAAGRRAAEAQGAELSWQEGDAERLPYPDGAFDVVLSCVGAMFAPHHQAVADELVRVCRPGGMIGLANWTPEGFIGQLFATMAPFAPPAPPGSQPPPRWGTEEHLTELFGARVELTTRRDSVRVDAFATPARFREFFKSAYGPAVAVYRSLADQPDRAAALDAALADLAARHDRGTTGRTSMDWEYLLVLGRVR